MPKPNSKMEQQNPTEGRVRSRACVTRVLVLSYICVFRTFIVVFERSLYLHHIGYSLGTLVVRLLCTLLACVSVYELLHSARSVGL